MKIVSYNSKLNPFEFSFSEYNSHYNECIEFLNTQKDADIICLQGIHSAKCRIHNDLLKKVVECIHLKDVNEYEHKEDSIDIYEAHIHMKYVMKYVHNKECTQKRDSVTFDSKCIIIDTFKQHFHYSYVENENESVTTDSGLVILSKLPISCSYVSMDNEFNGCIIVSAYSRSQQKPIHIMNLSYKNIYTFMGNNNYVSASVIKCLESIFKDEQVDVICGLWDSMHYKYVKQCAIHLNYRFTNPAPFENNNYILWKNLKCCEYIKINSGIQIKI